jgi:hypothetical protein
LARNRRANCDRAPAVALHRSSLREMELFLLKVCLLEKSLLAKLNQRFKREISATVPVIASRSFCGHEESVITANIAGRPARNRPYLRISS